MEAGGEPEQHNPGTAAPLQLSGNHSLRPEGELCRARDGPPAVQVFALTLDAQSGIGERDSLVNILVIIPKIYFNKLNS